MRMRTRLVGGKHSNLVLTFDDLLRRTPFVERMREILRLLEKHYLAAVDLEFTINLHEKPDEKMELCICILQCRPQSQLQESAGGVLPTHLRSEDIIFQTQFVVPNGMIDKLDYVVFIPPEEYFKLPTMQLRADLARAIGRLNAALEKENFITVGPGRWGSTNADLGVPIDYGDIYNTRALVELAGEGYGLPPEPSLGTHFFQDLLESQIYPLAVYLDDPASIFQRKFFYETPNRVSEFIQVEEAIEKSLRLVRVADFSAGKKLRIVMSDEESQAVGFVTGK